MTQESAKQIVLEELISKDIGKVDVYMLKEAGRKYDIGEEKKLQLFHGKTINFPYDNNWVFFVDDCPPMNWFHPCRYIFIDPETGDYNIVQHEVYPENLEEDYNLVAEMPRPKSSLLQKKINDLEMKSIYSATPNNNLYAVIISGTDYGRYWRDVSAIYCTIIEVYGFTKDNIFVLYDIGRADMGSDLDDPNDESDDIDYAAYKGTIERTFKNLSGEWTNDANVPELGENDHLFVFITDHGGRDLSEGEDHSYIVLPNDDLYDDELAGYVDAINCSQITFVMEQCYSGGFVDDLTDYSTYDVKCEHRTIYTACNYDEPSWSEMHISSQFYDEFVFYWTAAVRGYYPVINQPWNTNQSVGSFPFTNYATLANHPDDYDPDLNNDGIVQMEEAFDYANNFDTWSSYGYTRPYPTHLTSSELPQESNNIGFEEDLLGLEGISGTIENSQTVEGNFLVCGDLEVENNIALDINDSTTFNFVDGTGLTVNGSMDASGSATGPIIFTSANAIPSRSDWEGIYFENSSDDEDCILEYCVIEYANQGITCNSASPTIQNCQLSYCNKGIYLYNSSPTIESNVIYQNYYGIYGLTSSSPTITDNNIYNNSNVGAQFITNSVPNLFENLFESNRYGVYLQDESDARFGTYYGQEIDGDNIIKSSTLYGIKAYDDSDPFLGSTDIYNNQLSGNNSIYNNTSYNVYASTNSNVDAQWCWWGASPPPAKFYTYNNSTIDYSHYLGSDPNPLEKSTGSNLVSEKLWDYQSAGFNPRKPNRDSPTDLWFWGHDLIIHDKTEDAIEVYQLLIEKFSDSENSSSALGSIYHWYHDLERQGISEYLKSLIDNSQINSAVKQKAYELLLCSYLEEKDVMKAEDIGNLIFKQYPNSNSEKNALFNLVLANKYTSKKMDRSREYVSQMNIKYPNDELTLMAREAMGEEINWALFKPSINPEPEVAIILPDKYDLRNNYPNPFNPMTTIEYDLPEDSKVTLVVYDVIGREVTRLVETKAPAGFYKAIWDGKNRHGSLVSSGVYIYRIQAGSFNQTRKMIFIR